MRPCARLVRTASRVYLPEQSVAWCVDSENPLRILLVYFTVELTVDGRPNDPLAAGKYPGASSGQSASALEFIKPLSGFRKLFSLHRHRAVLQLVYAHWISNLNKHCNIHHSPLLLLFLYQLVYIYIYVIVLFLIYKNVSWYLWMGWKVTLLWKARTEAVYLIVVNFEVQSELKYTVTAALRANSAQRETHRQKRAVTSFHTSDQTSPSWIRFWLALPSPPDKLLDLLTYHGNIPWVRSDPWIYTALMEIMSPQQGTMGQNRSDSLTGESKALPDSKKVHLK